MATALRSALLSALVTALAATASAGTKLLRFPDLHGDRVVFCYGGDLWTVSDEGGVASRLTAHPGQELFPKFSPDGEWIAFTGQYDGDEQVYVMPSRGGAPTQLTFYPAEGPMPPRWGYDNQVYGWTPDGARVLFRSYRDGWDWGAPRLFTVAASGGLPEVLPMPSAGAGAFSPDGGKVVYSPLFRDFRSWKRYQGGWAQDLWVFDLATNAARNVTEHARSDRDPMWIGDSIWFASDRDDKLNLYRYDVAGRETTQVTTHSRWDVRWPSAAPDGRIVYELGGALRVLDTASGQSLELDVEVHDDGVAMRPARIDVADQIEGYDLSPKAERVLFVARGDVFTVPASDGVVRNLTRSSDAHEREAAWSPDGKRIAWVSDATGEEEIWVAPHDGAGPAVQVTQNTAGRLYDLRWSPDSVHLAYVTKEGMLEVVDVDSKETVEVHQEPFGRLSDHVWSPNGGWIAFSSNDPNELSAIWLWNAASRQKTRVTGEYFQETNPAWDPDGDYLYFLADHDFAPQIGSREWNYVVNRETGVFALALREDVPHPFPPKNDDVEVDGSDDDEEDESSEEEGEESGDEAPEPIEIDLEGLAERIVRVPVEGDNYVGLDATASHLLFVRTGPFFYGRGSGVDVELRTFDLEEREMETMVGGIGGYAVSADDEKVLVSRGGSYHLHDVGSKEGEAVSTAGLVMDRVPAEEWETIYDEVWRRFRDYFYAPNMHGYDWEALRQQYRPLLEHVAHRSDLNYVISELISELNVSHAYVSGGDFELPERPNVALLGARFALDAPSGRYRISRILPGQNAEERYRSPLTEVGVDVDEGDYVLAINGRDLSAADNPFRLLRVPAGSAVELLVNDAPSREGARTVVVNPISDENALFYDEWVAKNRAYVAARTGGRVGYVHVPDMGSNGIREFVKWYYGQVRKEGLVVDVRYNGGGNVSQMLIERLGRRLLGLDYARTYSRPTTYPSVTFHGHMVCLLNETSASDGDIFPWTFRRAGLGPLIGKRSWGGIIGITGHGPLLDGGGCNVPQFGNASDEGQWVVEGYGVDPDIEVENDVASVIAGKDNQLDRAIAEVLARMEAEPKALPARPADPVKNY